ncbi:MULTISPECIES: NUMOD4 motif-containing HNH endonuclease [Cytobacillus]|uniref:NUMOD4 motif-containing HNH endonuclease n=1 Tax=Cytobacillus TaxID=2675230 RepID=UPI0018CFC441|nr:MULTISPECIES: NUMOD4 motif-containing HNH endonuclease [Cytobacillus]MED1908548.1 NUMOD4 motif-containing HNH endonuclease [Cytobacillus firmus]USK43518.1 NUMOD4 motif-containing HNH endonuclease [Cytobacillus oceanisediminis]
MFSEEWRDVRGFEGYYKVSNAGSVKSLGKVITNSKGIRRVFKERILTQTINSTGYKTVTLISNNKRIMYRVHRLVADAFIDNPLKLRVVNHKNGEKTDNRVENLEWVTHLENVNHSIYDLNKIGGTNTEKPRGVRFNKQNNKWNSIIRYKKENINLGNFFNKEEAYKVYFEKFKELYGFEPWDLKKYCTHNEKTRTDKRGKPRGVVFVKKTGKWHARITFNKKVFSLLSSYDKSECYKAYYEKYIELFNEKPWDLNEFPTH